MTREWRTDRDRVKGWHQATEGEARGQSVSGSCSRVQIVRVPPETPFRYTERPPAPGLAEWILSYWHFAAREMPPAGEPYSVLPDGCTSVAVLALPSLPPAVVCVGPRATSFRPAILPGMQLAGFRLWPDTTQALLGVAPGALRDHQGPAPASIMRGITSLAAAVTRALPATGDEGPDRTFDALDRWAQETFADPAPPEPRVRRAVRAIAAARGEVSLAKVASAAHASSRQLQRLFPAATGLTVSEYARVRRLREALAMRLQEDTAHWSRIAAERGFADHAHLTREFLALAGVPPTEAARQLRRVDHRDVTP
jgi:AraC-like DNA-binding protein